MLLLTKLMIKIPKQIYYKNNLFQQLKGFCYTVQSGSMSGAAKKMHLSQGAVSLQIQSLERKLGVQLFDRDKNKVALTKEGKMFYAHSAPHIHGVEGLLEDFVKKVKQEKSQTIKIAANNVSICHILPKYIKKFETKNSQAKFEIKNIGRDEAIKRLQDDEVDMLIYSMQPNETPSELDFIPIVRYQPILLTKKNHPLTKKKKVTMRDIRPYKLLRLDKKFVTIPNFDEVAKNYGLQTKIEFEMANYEILKKFVREDVGVAILSSICLEGEEDRGLVAQSLSDYFPKILYGILVKNGKASHELLKDFIEMMRTDELLQSQLDMDFFSKKRGVK
jgi:DNA-binding transcriptional LysR family regulator